MTPPARATLVLALLVACVALGVALAVVWTRPLPDARHAEEGSCADAATLAEPARSRVLVVLGCP